MKNHETLKSWTFLNFLELSWTFKNCEELSWTFKNFHELSWTFMKLWKSWTLVNYLELSCTFMNSHELFKKSWKHETLQLQGDCAAMEHRCGASLVKSWNLHCSSFYNALLRRWVCSWALLTESVDGVTTLREKLKTNGHRSASYGSLH